MTREEVEEQVKSCIRRVASEQGLAIKAIEPQHRIVDDLGFQSLDVATLTVVLESTFHVDPFALNIAVITEIVSVKDVCDLYFRCLNSEGAQGTPANTDMEDERIQRRLSKRKVG